MKVQDLMTRGVRTIRRSERLDAAARAMWEGDCGAVPVLDEESRVVGMLTDRDICMAAWIAGEPLAEVPVTRAMSKRLIACHAGDDPRAAEDLMRDNQVRRLPVLDARERLVGILSLNDLAIEAAGERPRKDRHVTPEEVGRTLAAICRHRTEQPVAMMAHA